MEGGVFDDEQRRARGAAQASGAEPGKGKIGPPDLGVPEDSKRVGSAPMARRCMPLRGTASPMTADCRANCKPPTGRAGR